MFYLLNASPYYLVPKENSCSVRSVSTTSTVYPIPSDCRFLSFVVISGSSPVFVKLGTSTVSVGTGSGQSDMIVPVNIHIQIAVKSSWTHYAVIVSSGSSSLAVWGYE